MQVLYSRFAAKLTALLILGRLNSTHSPSPSPSPKSELCNLNIFAFVESKGKFTLQKFLSLLDNRSIEFTE